MSTIYYERINKLKNVMMEKNLDGIILGESSSIYYFTGSDAAQVMVYSIEEKEPILLTSMLEYYRLGKEKEIGKIYGYSQDTLMKEKFGNVIVGDFYKSLNVVLEELFDKNKQQIGIGLRNISCSYMEKIKKMLGYEPEIVWKDVMMLRAVKDEHEIDLINKAIKITEQTMEGVFEYLERGITEMEVVGFIQKEFRKRNALDAFFPIVAFGEHSCHPHAVPSSKKLRMGDLVKIDIGARYNGYCADITRTFVFGKASEKQKRIINIVLEVQKESLRSIKIGMHAAMIDEKAREVFKKYGLVEYFIHSLGHGVGIDVHELPYVGPTSKDTIMDGFVFTIEPGIYIEGFGGVRIEDMVYIKDGKPLLLTTFRKVVNLE